MRLEVQSASLAVLVLIQIPLEIQSARHALLESMQILCRQLLRELLPRGKIIARCAQRGNIHQTMHQLIARTASQENILPWMEPAHALYAWKESTPMQRVLKAPQCA
jgi:hypothetical protein